VARLAEIKGSDGELIKRSLLASLSPSRPNGWKKLHWGG
jgi:hypothetical protein